MKLMGVQIHNRHLARKLQESEERYAAVVEQGHDGMLIARGDRILQVAGSGGKVECKVLAEASTPPSSTGSRTRMA